jgi:hypothetical protein
MVSKSTSTASAWATSATTTTGSRRRPTAGAAATQASGTRKSQDEHRVQAGLQARDGRPLPLPRVADRRLGGRPGRRARLRRLGGGALRGRPRVLRAGAQPTAHRGKGCPGGATPRRRPPALSPLPCWIVGPGAPQLSTLRRKGRRTAARGRAGGTCFPSVIWSRPPRGRGHAGSDRGVGRDEAGLVSPSPTGIPSARASSSNPRMAGIVASASGPRRLPPSRTKSFCMSTTTNAVRAGSTRTASWTSYSGTSMVRLIGASSNGSKRREALQHLLDRGALRGPQGAVRGSPPSEPARAFRRGPDQRGLVARMVAPIAPNLAALRRVSSKAERA